MKKKLFQRTILAATLVLSSGAVAAAEAGAIMLPSPIPAGCFLTNISASISLGTAGMPTAVGTVTGIPATGLFVVWGDGTSSLVSAASPTTPTALVHTYSVPGSYVVQLQPGSPNCGVINVGVIRARRVSMAGVYWPVGYYVPR